MDIVFRKTEQRGSSACQTQINHASPRLVLFLEGFACYGKFLKSQLYSNLNIRSLWLCHFNYLQYPSADPSVASHQLEENLPDGFQGDLIAAF